MVQLNDFSELQLDETSCMWIEYRNIHEDFAEIIGCCDLLFLNTPCDPICCTVAGGVRTMEL